MKKLTDLEIKVLNRIQKDWEITPAPFLKLSEELNISENELINTIKKLKDENIIRDISAIFNAGSLGYDSSLIAFKVREKNIDTAASVINANPGVSHNYLRDHTYNIWFTLAVSPDTSLKEEIETIAEESKADDFLIFRNEKLLKIGLILDLDGNGNPDSDKINSNSGKQGNYKPLSDEEKKAVYILQTDIPLVTRPFRELIEKSGLDIQENRLVELWKKFKEDKMIRRYSAILKHSKAGFSHNAMTAWKLNKNDDADKIKIFSSQRAISHLYIRTIYPGKWEHGLFAMIHARSGEELESIIKKLEKESGIKDYLVLHSIKEFKKQRVKYFSGIAEPA